MDANKAVFVAASFECPRVYPITKSDCNSAFLVRQVVESESTIDLAKLLR